MLKTKEDVLTEIRHKFSERLNHVLECRKDWPAFPVGKNPTKEDLELAHHFDSLIDTQHPLVTIEQLEEVLKLINCRSNFEIVPDTSPGGLFYLKDHKGVQVQIHYQRIPSLIEFFTRSKSA